MRMKCGCQFQISFSCAHKLCQSFFPSPEHITFHCITSNKFRFKWWLKHWVSNWHDRSNAMHSSWLEANWYTMMTVRLISHQIESVVYICDRWNNVDINLDPNSVMGFQCNPFIFMSYFFSLNWMLMLKNREISRIDNVGRRLGGSFITYHSTATRFISVCSSLWLW